MKTLKQWKSIWCPILGGKFEELDILHFYSSNDHGGQLQDMTLSPLLPTKLHDQVVIKQRSLWKKERTQTNKKQDHLMAGIIIAKLL